MRHTSAAHHSLREFTFWLAAVFMAAGIMVATARSQVAGGHQFEVPTKSVKQNTGFAFSVNLPSDWAQGDSMEKPNSSSLRVFEDGIELGPGHASHATIRSEGSGRFSHWQNQLYFSTSDNTDPRSNGREYVAALKRPTSMTNAPTVQALGTGQELIRIANEDIRVQLGHRYECDVPNIFWNLPTDQETGWGSVLAVYEDGRPLPHPNSRHEDIKTRGGGRYSHFQNLIWFSSTDQSDPRTNGRTYAIGIRPRADHRFIDRSVKSVPETVDSLPAPVLAGVSEGELVTDPRPLLRVSNADPTLLHYWELDSQPSFDSPMLHRRPRVVPGVPGIHPLLIMDRQAEFGPDWRPPYRLGALAPLTTRWRSPYAIVVLALRLGYGLPVGEDEIREVYEFVRAQIYPNDDDATWLGLSETLARDRGKCVSVNSVTYELLSQLGYSARRVCVQAPWLEYRYGFGEGAHSALEVYFESRWSVIDPFLQHFIYGTSFENLAGETERRYHGTTVNRKEGHERLTDEQLTLYLRDYAQTRRYDLFNGYTEVEGDFSPTEKLAFSGEPAIRLDPPISSLWKGPQVDLWVRVRGLRVDREHVTILPAAHFGKRRDKSPIEATPWTVVNFRLDLEAAYGPGRRASPAAP